MRISSSPTVVATKEPSRRVFRRSFRAHETFRSTLAFCIGVVGLVAAACSDAPVSEVRGIQPATRRSSLSPADSVLPDYIVTPAGQYHRTCVHELPAAASFDADGVLRLPNGVVVTFPPCQFPIYPSRPFLQAPFGDRIVGPTANGWLEYVYAYADTATGGVHPAFGLLTADIIVPPNPTTSYSTPAKVYYAFPGLEPTNQTVVIQPVIQYGNNRGFGGAYWTMASWSCGGLWCLHSTPVTVYAGDSITTSTQVWSSEFGYNCSNGICISIYMANQTHTGTTTGLFVPQSQSELYTIAFAGVVEVHNLNSCNEFPASPVRFVNVFLSEYDGSSPPGVYGPQYYPPTWYSFNQLNISPNCNFNQTFANYYNGLNVSRATLFHSP